MSLKFGSEKLEIQFLLFSKIRFFSVTRLTSLVALYTLLNHWWSFLCKQSVTLNYHFSRHSDINVFLFICTYVLHKQKLCALGKGVTKKKRECQRSPAYPHCKGECGLIILSFCLLVVVSALLLLHLLLLILLLLFLYY